MIISGHGTPHTYGYKHVHEVYPIGQRSQSPGGQGAVEESHWSTAPLGGASTEHVQTALQNQLWDQPEAHSSLLVLILFFRLRCFCAILLLRHIWAFIHFRSDLPVVMKRCFLDTSQNTTISPVIATVTPELHHVFVKRFPTMQQSPEFSPIMLKILPTLTPFCSS